jgi:putative transposase
MCGVFREGVAMRYVKIEAMRPEYPVAMICATLEVSESGYHAWRSRGASKRSQEEGKLCAQIAAAHVRTRQTYAPERLQADLRDHGVTIGVYRIKRIRKQLNLRCRHKRQFKLTTHSKHDFPIAANLLDQKFGTTAPSTGINSSFRSWQPILRS